MEVGRLKEIKDWARFGDDTVKPTKLTNLDFSDRILVGDELLVRPTAKNLQIVINGYNELIDRFRAKDKQIEDLEDTIKSLGDKINEIR